MTGDALREAAAAVERHRTSAELSYLHALLLSATGAGDAALAAARGALYLDGDFAPALLLAGSLHARAGRPDDARRALEHAERVLSALPADGEVPGGDGEAAARIVSAVREQLAALGGGR
jgi:chemotaxis protein methyltransferase CheR